MSKFIKLLLAGIFLIICIVSSCWLLTPQKFIIFIFALSLLALGFLAITKYRSDFFFYVYIGSLFYIEYIKLIFPGLPIKIIPDLVFFLLLLRISFFEREVFLKTLSKNKSVVLDWLLKFYIIFIFFEIFNPNLPDILIGFQAFRTHIKMLAVFWIGLYMFYLPQRRKNFLKFLRINIAITFLFSFKQIFFGFSNFELAVYCPPPVRRIYSSFANPAVFSIILGFGIIDAFLLFIYEQKTRYFFMVIAYTLVSFLTLHRSPLLAAFVSVMLLAVCLWKRIGLFVSENTHKISIALISIFLLLLTTVLFTFPPRIQTLKEQAAFRISEMIHKGKNEGGLQVRINQLEPAIKSILPHPFGAGIGYTSLYFGTRLENFSVLKGIHNYVTRFETGSGDNSYLIIFIETGVIGLGYFLVLILMSIVSSFSIFLKQQDKNKTSNESHAAALAFGSLLLIIIVIFTSGLYTTLIIGTFFWLWLSMSLSVVNGFLSNSSTTINRITQ